MAKMTLDEVLANLQLYTDERDYSIVQLPARAITLAAGIVAEIADPFTVLIVDKDEVTLVIPSELVPEFDRRIPPGTPTLAPYRLITFDVELDSGLTGFMATITRPLADAGIPVMPFAAFSRDHLLIPSEHFTRTVSVLENLRSRH
jgi:hypothetical protein